MPWSLIALASLLLISVSSIERTESAISATEKYREVETDTVNDNHIHRAIPIEIPRGDCHRAVS